MDKGAGGEESGAGQAQEPALTLGALLSLQVTHLLTRPLCLPLPAPAASSRAQQAQFLVAAQAQHGSDLAELRSRLASRRQVRANMLSCSLTRGMDAAAWDTGTAELERLIGWLEQQPAEVQQSGRHKQQGGRGGSAAGRGGRSRAPATPRAPASPATKRSVGDPSSKCLV